MKQITLFLCLFMVCKFAFGQSTEKLPVPILKESARIDSLMEIVLDPNNPDKFERIKSVKDSCFTIALIKRGANYSFQIEKITRPITNIWVNNAVKYNAIFGYFNYRNYKIFVWTRDDFHDFFSKTSNTETFNFIYKTDNITPPRGEYFLAIWHYGYENGKWSVEGPPAVR